MARVVGKFEKILARTTNQRSLQPYQKSKQWLRNTASKVQRVNRNALFNNNHNVTTRVLPGRMYMYFYDPKTKEDLPYYDTFPLIFPVEMYKDGFLGINLHYLPRGLRAKLMDALYDIANNNNKDESTRLILSYNVLKSAAKYRLFKPCLKRYLSSHLKSNFVEVPAQEWDMALMLPLERFKKASSSKVWADSRKMIK